MSILERTIHAVRSLLAGERRSTSFDSLGGGLPVYDGSRLELGMDVNRAMRFTPVYAAIRLRSNTIASLPKSVYDLEGKGRSVAARHQPPTGLAADGRG